MMARFFKSRQRPAVAGPFLPDGERVYAIGDVHGCLGMLDDLLARIEADDASRDDAATTIIFLGDLVDRGPDSAGVVARVRELARTRPVRVLKGNHEEIFLRAMEGERDALRLFCRVGGRETALSYGIDDAAYERSDFDELADLLAAHVSPEDRAFIDGFEDMVVAGDYVFVHAGVDPRVPLAEQTPAQLRWIRDRFLDHGTALEKHVVHGHTISETVEYRSHRIGIDTGAFSTGRLTALGLQGSDSWELTT
ncbi:serine/threonine protein phosphatase 1 [Sphingomonas gellani]|uniref:Serine/threonine protein phosphatase 1 n=1 Tax=Sphingomonas gellani TaxID=1166340 RepID=A0A1H7Y199_9SPHN|nr:metallophosphoesterase family protein [Sphingomonas gellani]SEM39128.1 serine/threonine protein phosphatase 1 [Sphingomonas gellani]